MSATQATSSGRPRDRKRFTTEDHPNIEDVANPHTIEDDTREPLRKRAWEYRWFLVLGIPVGFAAVAILIGYTWHLIPELLGNRYVQLAAAFATTIAVTAYLTDQRRLSWFKQGHEVLFRTPNDPLRFRCEILRTEDGEPAVAPIKGYRWFGSVPVYYTIEEFSLELADTWASMNRDPNDPAIIRLHPGFATVAETDLGKTVEQSTGGIEVDPFGRHSTLYATIPEFIEDDVADDLRGELVRTREERDELESRLEDTKRRLEAAKEIGAMDPEEFTEKQIEFYERIRGVETGRRKTRQNSQNGSAESIGTSTQTDPELKRIEAELSQDD